MSRKALPGRRAAVHRRSAERVPASEFKNRCLRFLDRVQQTREEIVVTKYGKPVAKLVAYEPAAKPRLFGYLAGSITVHNDIVSPLGEEWEADA